MPRPLPHIALFTPGDVSTLHDSPSFGSFPGTSPTGSVRGDPSGAPRIEAYFTANGVFHGFSDSPETIESYGDIALAIAPENSNIVFEEFNRSLADPGPNYVRTSVGMKEITLARVAGNDVPSRYQSVASDDVEIVRAGDLGAWMVTADASTPIEIQPLAWSGDAFVTYDQGALQLYDHDFQPTETVPLDVPDATLLGVGATPERALFAFASASSSTDVDYVQVCF